VETLPVLSEAGTCAAERRAVQQKRDLGHAPRVDCTNGRKEKAHVAAPLRGATVAIHRIGVLLIATPSPAPPTSRTAQRPNDL